MNRGGNRWSAASGGLVSTEYGSSVPDMLVPFAAGTSTAPRHRYRPWWRSLKAAGRCDLAGGISRDIPRVPGQNTLRCDCPFSGPVPGRDISPALINMSPARPNAKLSVVISAPPRTVSDLAALTVSVPPSAKVSAGSGGTPGPAEASGIPVEEAKEALRRQCSDPWVVVPGQQHFLGVDSGTPAGSSEEVIHTR